MEVIKHSSSSEEFREDSNKLCMICLEDLDGDARNIIKLKPQISVTSETCNCNVTIHINCNDMMNRMGLYCPICRIRVEDILCIDTAKLIFWITNLFIILLIII